MMLRSKVGNYTVVEKLAEGGMGEVYIAHHELMQREAVVKVLRPEMSVRKDMVKRFFNEARAATSIHHPGIVEVFDMGFDDDGRAYIVMEKLRGESLAARLVRGPMVPAQAVAFTRQIAGALGAAHQRGIVHRDLKPDNLFIVPDPEVQGGERIKVLDFGIAKLAMDKGGSLMTAAGAIFGTPAYMAPEQCTSTATVDQRADIYAVGCIFYEMLCGRPPFGQGGLELLAAQLRDPPPPLRSIDPNIPIELEQVALKMLEKRLEDRFQSCEEIVATLAGGAGDAMAGLVGASAGPGLAAGSWSPTPDMRSAAPDRLGQASAEFTGSQPPAVQPSAGFTASRPPGASSQPPAAQSQSPATNAGSQPPAVHPLTTHGAAVGEVDFPQVPGQKKQRGGLWLAVAAVAVVGIGGVVAAVTLGGSGDGAGATVQSFAEAMALVCEAPNQVDRDLPPDQRAAEIARWASERITNPEARQTLAQLATIAPGERTEKLAQAVKAAGLTSCAWLEPGPEVAQLEEARAAMAAENWSLAAGKAAEVLVDHPEQPEARELKERAEREIANHATFDKLESASQAKQHEVVARQFHEISEDSIYRERAQPLYDQAREQWLGPYLDRARGYVKKGRCAKVGEIATEVAEVFPEGAAEIERTGEGCREAVASVSKDAPEKKPDPPPKEEPGKKPAGKDADALEADAKKAMMSGQMVRAIAFYRRCVQADRKRCSCYRGMGMAQAKAGNLPAAKRSYQQYLKICPGAKDAKNIGALLEKWGN